MNEQSPQESVPPSPVLHQAKSISSMLPPANPIMNKSIHAHNQKVAFRLDTSKPVVQNEVRKVIRHAENTIQKSKQESRHEEVVNARRSMDRMTLINGYEPSTMLFTKFDNKNCNQRARVKYFASIFLPLEIRTHQLPEYKGMIFDDQLIFDSNYQSANLMAVFKIDNNTYDLILQNDLNTKGFTQWFNFKVHNKRNNFVAKFNIVNLYKAKSLYNMGMKPIVRSYKSEKGSRKGWRRKGFGIYYQKNQLHYEDNEKKYYKTLCFEYDFTVQNDIVQFAHCMPYDLNDLKKMLEAIKNHPKVTITTIGSTIMGKSIPMINISMDSENRVPKKAIVILGRQHPGETPGSYIGEEMVFEFLKNSKEMQFLLWKFDIFIFPVVNIDGVFLGNYRGNFAGFDLNRCWLKPDPLRQPQVFQIKSAIKKIAKKQQIELVIDLHGHSRKMGSFFYGNDFGSNYMLFPYIASKMNRNILFEKSKFTRETENDAKFSTARVVLGNFVKDNGGYVFTYEVSFFGYYKQNTESPFSFTEEHYKQLGKALVGSIYRTYLEIYKEEKTLKESLYLKTIKNEIKTFNDEQGKQEDSQSGSDSEAAEQMKEEIKAIEEFIEQCRKTYEKPSLQVSAKKEKSTKLKRENTVFQKMIEQKVTRGPPLAKHSMPTSSSKQFREVGLPVERYNHELKRKIEELMDRNMQNDLKNVFVQRLPTLAANRMKSEQKRSEDNQLQQNDFNGIEMFRKNPQMAYLDYLKMKKQQQRECQSSLQIHGAHFQLRGKGHMSQPPKSPSLNLRNEPQSDSQLNRHQLLPFAQHSRGYKSNHTIDVSSLEMSPQERDLISQRPYIQKRKISSNHYILKQQGRVPEERGLQTNLSKNSFQINRLQIKSPLKNRSELLPALSSQLQPKQKTRLKLPSI